MLNKEELTHTYPIYEWQDLSTMIFDKTNYWWGCKLNQQNKNLISNNRLSIMIVLIKIVLSKFQRLT